jgi:hypothetical protein
LQFANGENNYTLSWNGAVSAKLLLNDANNNTQIAIDASNERIAINDTNNGYYLYLDASNGISLFDNSPASFSVYNGILSLTSTSSPHISINGTADFATYSTNLILLNDINNNVANYRVFNLDLFSINANAHIIVSADNSITGNIDTVNTALVVTAGTGQYPIYVSSVTTISIGDNYDAGNSTTFKFDDFLKTITANNYSDFYFQNGNITAKSFITEGGLITQFVAGNGSLINQSNFTYTSSNGITKTTNDFKLGGTLSQATTITTDSYYLNVNATRQINNAVNYSSVNALTINGVTSNDLGGRAYAANLCETVYSSNANITGQSDTTYTNLAAFTYFISNNYFTTSFTAPLSSVTAWVNFSGSGNVTTYAGIFVKAPRQYIGSPAFTGTLTNFCGLLIDNINASDITGRITNRYAIYQSGANDINYFAGEIRIGNAVSASVLNTVTNKIKIIVGGTTYYLLASTSST